MTHGLPAPRATGPDLLTVGRAAALAGVSVKTLHHWEAVGLVRPGGRSRAGYRIYSADDIARIHRVLVYREIGFPLAEIGRILDDPDTGADDHLRRQRSLLTERIAELERMVDGVDRLTAARRTGITLTLREQAEIFGTGWRISQVEAAGECWGDSPQWAQATERAAARSADDWREVTAASTALDADLVSALRSGVSPGSAAANTLAERHRELMSGYFDCTRSMQVCIARKFVSEQGWADHYDAMAPGLASWLWEIVAANAAAHGIDPDTAVWE
ncbi:MerR family transcriptional regulator [Streptomyces sp. NPDC003691]